MAIEQTGAFDGINGILVGKPQDERYYEEYKSVYLDILGSRALPILYNVNFGHATPRTALPYGAKSVGKRQKQLIEFV